MAPDGSEGKLARTRGDTLVAAGNQFDEAMRKAPTPIEDALRKVASPDKALQRDAVKPRFKKGGK
jgi:hypothetical protein